MVSVFGARLSSELKKLENFRITFSPAGEILEASSSNGKWFANLSTQSMIGSNHSVDYSTIKADAAGVITVIRHVTATTETSDATDTIERQLLLTDVYAVIKNSDVISWTSHVEEKASSEETGYWSSSWSKTVSVKTDNGASKNWWASSSGPLLELADNDNNRLDILTMRDSSSANYTCAYGGVNYWQQFDFDVFLPDELCPVPASIHGAGISGGLSHVLDIDETILAAFGSFSPESVKWVRYFDRMGGGGVRSTTSFLVFQQWLFQPAGSLITSSRRRAGRRKSFCKLAAWGRTAALTLKTC